MKTGMRLFVNKIHIISQFSNYVSFLMNTHNYYFLTIKFMDVFVMYHLEMELKQNEGKSNSVTKD